MRIDPHHLTYSVHARQRMTERQISRAQVELAVTRPRKIYGDCRTPGVIHRRYVRDDLVVVLDADGPRGVVITTYQRDPAQP